jgi:hypothetical protein
MLSLGFIVLAGCSVLLTTKFVVVGLIANRIVEMYVVGCGLWMIIVIFDFCC